MTALLTSPPSVTIPSPYRLSVPQFQAMITSGLIGPEERVELLDGFLVKKMTKHTPHTVTTQRTQAAIDAVLPPGYHIRSREPILFATSVPEPDLCVVCGVFLDYLPAHPSRARSPW